MNNFEYQWINENVCLLWRILLIRSLIQTRIKRGITTGNETGSSYNRKSDRKWVHRSKGRLNTCTSHKLGGWHRKESGLTDNRKLKPEMMSRTGSRYRKSKLFYEVLDILEQSQSQNFQTDPLTQELAHDDVITGSKSHDDVINFIFTIGMSHKHEDMELQKKTLLGMTWRHQWSSWWRHRRAGISWIQLDYAEK